MDKLQKMAKELTEKGFITVAGTTKKELTISALKMSAKAYNILEKNNIKTLEQLANLTKTELKKLKNLGPILQEEIENALLSYGLTLKCKKEITDEKNTSIPGRN